MERSHVAGVTPTSQPTSRTVNKIVYCFIMREV